MLFSRRIKTEESPARHTFRKRERISRNSDFRALIKSGKKVKTPHFLLYAKGNSTEINRIGIAVPKNTGSSPVRNRCRRRVREIYRTNKHFYKQGFNVLVFCREDISGIGFDDLKIELLESLKKALR